MALTTATAAPEVVELEPEDGRWLRLARDAPEATPFHQATWLRALTATYRYRALVAAQLDSSGEVTAGVPLLKVRRPLAGTIYVSLPFTDQVAPLTRTEQGLAELTAGLESWREQKGGPGIEIRTELPPGKGRSVIEAGLRHLLALEPGAPELRSLKPSVSRHVRAAQRAGLTVRVSRSAEDLATFYRLHLQTRRRLGVPIQPWRFIRGIWENLVQPGLGFLAITESAQEDALAAALFLVHNRTIVYKYGASDSAHWHLKPNHLLFWRVLEWAGREGFQLLDLGRSDAEGQGLRQFKAGWGATETPLRYTRLGRSGGPATGKPRLGSALHTVIRRSPPFVCRAVGELLYRYAA
jgi:CelD/BcsL family acetyltransferase involved in cellulose biosynthesis